MAKKPKVPLNVLVIESTRMAVKELADIHECSQGEVVDRAVLAFRDGEYSAVAKTDAIGETKPVVDNRPKNATCRHCGERFAGQRFATICQSCKSSGHTLTPAECPPCNEGRAI